MARSFLQYDVFTGTPMLGNQLAVFPDARGLDTVMMQRIACEMNFAESTFILPVEWAGTDIRMRIFTPAVEMPMAGHPTIGSTFALAHEGVIAPGTSRFIFHLNAGPTPVDLEWDGDRLAFAWMTQPNPVFGRVVDDRAAVAALAGLTADDLLPGAPVQEVSCAVPFLYIPVRNAETVDRAFSDAAAFKRLAQTSGIDLPIFVFALGQGEADLDSRSPGSTAASASGVAAGGAHRVDAVLSTPSVSARRAERSDAAPSGESAPAATAVYSRMFAPGLGVAEDPATGIASGPLGSYLVRHGLVSPDQARAIVSHQGVKMGRASQIHISIGVADGLINDVRVGGEAVLVARGELLV